MKSDRAEEAERMFDGLLAGHGGSAQLNVLLGQAHAQQGDFDAARAVAGARAPARRDVAEAQLDAWARSTCGRAGWRRRSESCARSCAHTRTTGPRSRTWRSCWTGCRARRGGSAAAERPEGAAGKRGRALPAGQGPARAGGGGGGGENLEAAARLAPEDANIPYQLGQAYQELGRRSRPGRSSRSSGSSRQALSGSYSGSRSVSTWSAATCFRVCVLPEGQRIVSSPTTAPRPARNGRAGRTRSRTHGRVDVAVLGAGALAILSFAPSRRD